MAILTAGTWPQAKSEKLTAPVASDLRQLEIQFNLLLTNLSTYFNAASSQSVVTTTTPVAGTGVSITVPTSTVIVVGVPVLLAADTNKAISATGNTIKALKWGLFTIERVAAGTTTFVGAAGNSVGYATEALAIAAKPAVTAAKVRVAYVTVLAGAADWVGGTDALEGQTGGVASTDTNYYAEPSIFDTTAWTASQIANMSGTVLSSANY